MKIGLDLDDTITDHTQNVVKLAALYGVSASSMEHLDSLFLESKLDTTLYKNLKQQLYGSMSSDALPVPGSRDVINQLTQDNVPLFVISRREKSDYAREWLSKHIPVIESKNIYFVKEDREKGVLCNALGITLFLDNKKRVLEEMPPSVQSVLFDRFGLHKSAPFKNVSSWEEFYALYRELAA